MTVVDDGTIAERRGSLTIDGRRAGQPQRAVEDGRLVGYAGPAERAADGRRITDERTARGLCAPAVPRMTSTYMTGQFTPEEIIASVNGVMPSR